MSKRRAGSSDKTPECEVMPVMCAGLVLWSKASELDFDQGLFPNNQLTRTRYQCMYL